MSIFDQLKKLVDKFTKSIEFYKNASKYNEHNCRVEFIDPFFELLGWDISNKQGKLPQFREVITENYLSDTGRPDYSMTLNGVVKFHLEAKKPSVAIETDISPAYQVRRYGWSSNLRISVLTNFEYLIIYDTTVPPKHDDDSNVAVLKKYHYTEYIEKFDEIKDLISKDVIYNGFFDTALDNYHFAVYEKGLRLPVDEYFLNQINSWRLSLGDYLYKEKGYSIDIINDVIQEFVNQIIFLRICEDRNLPIYHTLKQVIQDDLTLTKELEKIFKEADKRYNSGLFSGKYLIFDLKNDIIKDIVEKLYYPQSPYVFTLIKPNLLGEVYEAFLAEYLKVDINGDVVLSKKKENINRDIVTTPIEIVKYMVNKSLQQVCIGKDIDEILKLTVSDVACGSGIFLIEAYDYLIRYCLSWYKENNIDFLIKTQTGDYKLPFEIKRKILLNCIYGIDIDVHAVEVAKFNLLIKLLEDETIPSLQDITPILPDLSNNIIHGNALIDFNNINYSKLSPDDISQIIPLDWSNVNSGNKFSVIIGNPPYVNTEDLNSLINPKEFKVYKSKYKSSSKQFDKYFIFIERALEKVSSGGYVCYIVPNKFAKIKSGEKLRELLTKNKYVMEFIDFGSTQLFKQRNKTVYSSIILLQKKPQISFGYMEVNNLAKFWANITNNEPIKLNSEILSNAPWALVEDAETMKIINNMYTNSQPLKEVATSFNGIQTSAERPPIYWFNNEEIIDMSQDTFTINKFGKVYKIEKGILRRYYKPVKKSEMNLGTYDVYDTDKYIIFPYDTSGRLYTLDTMKQIFPNTLAYLEDNYDELKPKQIDPTGRRDVPLATKDTWYQYGRDQALTAFNSTKKLIVGVLSKKPMYLYDKDDLIISSGGTAGYCAVAEKEDSPYCLEYLQAYLTHPTTEKLLSIIGSDFEGGFYSRGTSVLDIVPIKKLNFNNKTHKEIYDNVVCYSRRVYEINDRFKNKTITKTQQTSLLNEKSFLIKNIEELISKVYSI
ncbi:Eco57I restriction-modification methylase domain-containing protein [Clostridium beijerinckii]|uniref:site-specific DNA-methyltransferase (adenine-specific) n=1 Tax=Clostridium beijerinckii TaxID=1520 RepID=A0A7X9SRT1_CLOBE|nr:DNA methyltransferase [Clostridium beijerinckii]NMF06870.1 N-6 DNA methylase [Clostridium beijerinckii]